MQPIRCTAQIRHRARIPRLTADRSPSAGWKPLVNRQTTSLLSALASGRTTRRRTTSSRCAGPVFNGRGPRSRGRGTGTTSVHGDYRRPTRSTSCRSDEPDRSLGSRSTCPQRSARCLTPSLGARLIRIRSERVPRGTVDTQRPGRCAPGGTDALRRADAVRAPRHGGESNPGPAR